MVAGPTSAAPAEAAPAPDLRRLGDQDFRDLVDADIRGELTAEQRDLLRAPGVVDRWYARLIDAQKMTEASFRIRKAEFDRLRDRTWQTKDHQTYFRARDDYQSWHARALWASRCIQERIAEAKEARRAVNVASQRVRDETAQAVLRRIAWQAEGASADQLRALARAYFGRVT